MDFKEARQRWRASFCRTFYCVNGVIAGVDRSGAPGFAADADRLGAVLSLGALGRALWLRAGGRAGVAVAGGGRPSRRGRCRPRPPAPLPGPGSGLRRHCRGIRVHSPGAAGHRAVSGAAGAEPAGLGGAGMLHPVGQQQRGPHPGTGRRAVPTLRRGLRRAVCPAHSGAAGSGPGGGAAVSEGGLSRALSDRRSAAGLRGLPAGFAADAALRGGTRGAGDAARRGGQGGGLRAAVRLRPRLRLPGGRVGRPAAEGLVRRALRIPRRHGPRGQP